MGKKRAKPAGIIALITDFGTKDPFVAIIKAVILNISPSAKFIDITHSVSPQNIKESAFMLAQSYRFFPDGTVFLVVVDPAVGSERRAIIVETERFFFVAPDNGILSHSLKEQKIVKIISIKNERYFLTPVSQTFHGRDIFSPVTAFLLKGVQIEEFGTEIKKIKELKSESPVVKKDNLKGSVEYIDNFGNIITNIHKRDIDRLIKKKLYLPVNEDRGEFVEIIIKDFKIKGFSRNYESSSSDKPFALFNSFDLLEIALKEKRAEKLLNVREGEKIIVRIKEKKLKKA